MPGLLRRPPINAFEQITQLRRGNRHRAVGWRGPEETPALQPLGEQASTLAIMPDDFDEIAATTAENEKMPAMRIALQRLLPSKASPGKPRRISV